MHREATQPARPFFMCETPERLIKPSPGLAGLPKKGVTNTSLLCLCITPWPGYLHLPRPWESSRRTSRVVQAGHSRANTSRLSLTRCCFWNAAVPEKLKGQPLSELDVNRSLFLLHASTRIPRAMQSLIASGLQGSTHSTALPMELQASKEFSGGKEGAASNRTKG